MSDRKELVKQLFILAAAGNANMPHHARRIANARFRLDYSYLEFEAAAAELAAEAMRAVAQSLEGGAS